MSHSHLIREKIHSLDKFPPSRAWPLAEDGGLSAGHGPEPQAWVPAPEPAAEDQGRAWERGLHNVAAASTTAAARMTSAAPQVEAEEKLLPGSDPSGSGRASRPPSKGAVCGQQASWPWPSRALTQPSEGAQGPAGLCVIDLHLQSSFPGNSLEPQAAQGSDAHAAQFFASYCGSSSGTASPGLQGTGQAHRAPCSFSCEACRRQHS